MAAVVSNYAKRSVPLTSEAIGVMYAGFIHVALPAFSKFHKQHLSKKLWLRVCRILLTNSSSFLGIQVNKDFFHFFFPRSVLLSVIGMAILIGTAYDILFHQPAVEKAKSNVVVVDGELSFLARGFQRRKWSPAVKLLWCFSYLKKKAKKKRIRFAFWPVRSSGRKERFSGWRRRQTLHCRGLHTNTERAAATRRSLQPNSSAKWEVFSLLVKLCRFCVLWFWKFFFSSVSKTAKEHERYKRNSPLFLLFLLTLADIPRRVLLAFSLYSNAQKILNTKRTPGELDCVHGIRFLSMSWVILGHVLVFLVNPGFFASKSFPKKKIKNQSINCRCVPIKTFWVK